MEALISHILRSYDVLLFLQLDERIKLLSEDLSSEKENSEKQSKELENRTQVLEEDAINLKSEVEKLQQDLVESRKVILQF